MCASGGTCPDSHSHMTFAEQIRWVVICAVIAGRCWPCSNCAMELEVSALTLLSARVSPDDEGGSGALVLPRFNYRVELQEKREGREGEKDEGRGGWQNFSLLPVSVDRWVLKGIVGFVCIRRTDRPLRRRDIHWDASEQNTDHHYCAGVGVCMCRCLYSFRTKMSSLCKENEFEDSKSLFQGQTISLRLYNLRTFKHMNT